MSSMKDRQKQQGYCSTIQRPMCDNCTQHLETDTGSRTILTCKTGGFPIAMGGWCPSWQPQPYWPKHNPVAHAQMFGGKP
jgi:ribosomal protein L37AE/L43A